MIQPESFNCQVIDKYYIFASHLISMLAITNNYFCAESFFVIVYSKSQSQK